MTVAANAISHSTFNPEYIRGEVARRYAVAGTLHAQLLYRGINDVYILRDDNGRRALRVWRSGTRSVPGVLQELDFLDFLTAAGIPVSHSQPTAKGERYFMLEAPEGPRPAVLYTWAPGRKFGDQLDTALAEKIGALFARLHVAARDYRPEGANAPVVGSFAENLPFLNEWVEDRPDDLRDYAKLTEVLPERIATFADRDLPWGMCHMDMHPSNVHVDAKGGITFIDFDGCAPGYWLLDVKNFIFGNAFYGFDPKYGEAFERGYLKERPYTADERELGEFFLLVKAFRLIGGAARTAPTRGRDLLRFRTLDWFSTYIKSRARALGLL